MARLHTLATTTLLIGALGGRNVAHAEPPEPSADRQVLEVHCGGCHALEVGAKARWGPSLVGVLGRSVGSEPDYRYGPYLEARRAEGAVWTEGALRTWLVDSKDVARSAGSRTKMPAQKLEGVELERVISALRGQP